MYRLKKEEKMRKTLSVVLACALVVGFSSLALAEENKDSGVVSKATMQDKGMTMCKMDKHEKMGICPMCSMMMKREVIATQDGGVIVMIGNKMLKYDKDLNLVKEVEVKMDVEGMHKMMMEMKEKCPMCKKMKECCGMKAGDKQETTKPEAPAVPAK
jgi:hypothetical protein